MTSIVDTNAILVANGQHDGVSAECVTACVVRLDTIIKKGRIALDNAYAILAEYQNKTSPWEGKRPGDVFLKWVIQNSANPQRCDQVPITPDSSRGYAEFPDDERLADFDADDRKFVAVAAVHPEHPPILQAADAKWLGWAQALRENGVTVDFLCKDDIRRFRKAKSAND